MSKPNFTKTPKSVLPRDPKEICQWTRDAVRDWIKTECEAHDHVNTIEPCEEGNDPCPCSHDGASKVDLVILIDSSGSMSDSAKAIGSAAKKALSAAQSNCGAEDVRVKYFTVDQEEPGKGSVPAVFQPQFTHTHQEYLISIGAPGPFAQDDTVGAAYGGQNGGEEGADSIADIANFMDWRKGTCRAILYVSDTSLEGDKLPDSVQDAAVARAVSAAKANNVTIFAHFTEDFEYGNDATWVAHVKQDYTNLTTQTGGRAKLGGKPSVKLYEELLKDAVCNACGICEPFEWPDLKPCISIKWGNSKCDSMESHDDERLCITICNCYQNVTFKNLSIGYIWLVDEKGNIPATLPDGNPSARIYPVGPICFGDILPCGEEGASCVTQEAVIINRNAKAGKYKILIGDVCFGIEHHYRQAEQEFCFDICQD